MRTAEDIAELAIVELIGQHRYTPASVERVIKVIRAAQIEARAEGYRAGWEAGRDAVINAAYEEGFPLENLRALQPPTRVDGEE